MAAAGWIAVADGECQRSSSDPLENCCCLGYNYSTSFNKRRSGVYTLANFCGVKCLDVEGYCDSTSGGGGWLVVQRRRQSLKQKDYFHRDWVEYEDGFGSLTAEFWYGLRALHYLTSQGDWEMRIDFQLSNGTRSYMHYGHFRVGPAEDSYRLSISDFKGSTPTDPFSAHHNTMEFTTRDRDNDRSLNNNCAVQHSSGWWYNKCFTINLNYHYDKSSYGLIRFGYNWHSPQFLEMKIRLVNCTFQ